MSDFANKLFSKLMILIVIVLFIVAFRESILTDDALSDVFAQLMGALPFSEVIAEVICQILKYSYEIPLITTSSVLEDLLKLAIMACIQPLVGRFLSMLFLRLPAYTAGDYEEQEKYMKKLPYKCKEALVTVVSAPLVALAAANLTAAMSGYINQRFGPTAASVIGAAAVVVIGAISLWSLLAAGVSAKVAITWRLLVTFLSKMATTFMTNALCLWIYAAFLGAVEWQIVSAIVTLIVWLILADLFVQGLQRKIVSR